MQICKDHWDKLRTAIKDRGLDHLVARSGEQASENLETGTYDPLMDCHFMISRRGLEAGGPYLLGTKPDGSAFCPICEALEHRPDDVALADGEAYWIDGPADSVLRHCREQGLVPPVQ